MSMQQSRMWCRSCNSYVLASRPGTSHVLHLLLSVFTLGLWIPVWILCSIKIGGWRCQQCGRGAGAGAISAIVAITMIALAVVAAKAGGLW